MPARSNLIGMPKQGRKGPALSLETVISRHPFLAGLSPHQLRLLSDCAMLAHFTKGELIFKEGDPANRFYLIEKGRVGLECNIREKGSTLIELVGRGDVLGWSWLFPPYCWHFDARALEPIEAILVYATPLRDACELDCELGYELFRRMAEVMLTRFQATRRQLLHRT